MVRVGVAEEDFEGAGGHKDELGRMKDEKATRQLRRAAYVYFDFLLDLRLS
jgi:hypothetical protein